MTDISNFGDPHDFKTTDWSALTGRVRKVKQTDKTQTPYSGRRGEIASIGCESHCTQHCAAPLFAEGNALVHHALMKQTPTETRNQLAVAQQAVVQQTIAWAIVICLSTLLLMLSGSGSLNAGVMSPVERPAIPDEDTKDESLLNLGPLGVRIKTTLDTRDLQGQAIGNDGAVAYIFKNSLSDGKLQIGDVVVGVDGIPFQKDLSVRMGNAINNAEGTTGALALQIVRQGKPLTVKFQLPILGNYSPTFPYQCPKTRLVFLQACDYLARHQLPHGAWDPLGSGIASTSAFAALALLSSGEEKYQKNIRAAVEFFLLVNDKGGLECWKLNHASIFLAEYYLQTGDPRVKAKLNELYKLIRNQQLTQTAYPFWFSHQKFLGKDVTKTSGYIYLGVNVSNALLAWSLMGECGIEMDAEHTLGTWNAVQVAGPTGEMPYAAAAAQSGGDTDAWGRTGVLAVANHLTPGQMVYGKTIAGALGRQWDRLYFSSHATSAMGKMWGTLGTAALDQALFRKLMDKYRYSLALMRLEDGRFVAQPGIGANNLYSTQSIDFEFGPVWTTAINALVFAPGFRNLRITGSGLIISGLDHNKLTGPVRAAFSALADGKYPTAISLLTKVMEDPKTSADDQKKAEMMQAYLVKKVAAERQSIEQLVVEGDILSAATRLSAFEKTYKGIDPIPEMTALKERFESAEGRKEQAIGKRYQTIVNAPTMTFANRITALTKFIKDNSESRYAAIAQRHLAEMENQKSAPAPAPAPAPKAAPK